MVRLTKVKLTKVRFTKVRLTTNVCMNYGILTAGYYVQEISGIRLSDRLLTHAW